MRRTVMVLAAAAFVACGGETHDGPDATTDGEADTGPGPTDAKAEKQWPIVYNIVDGGGDSPDCYYDGDIVRSCCNGEPCQGFCLLDDDGSIECSCYGIPGGCTGDYEGQPVNLCCSTIRGCTVTCAP